MKRSINRLSKHISNRSWLNVYFENPFFDWNRNVSVMLSSLFKMKSNKKTLYVGRQ
jgi:hypothetical protein